MKIELAKPQGSYCNKKKLFNFKKNFISNMLKLRIYRNTAKTFLAAASYMDLLRIFGNINKEVDI